MNATREHVVRLIALRGPMSSTRTSALTGGWTARGARLSRDTPGALRMAQILTRELAEEGLTALRARPDTA